MFVNTHGIKGLVLKTFPASRKGFYYSVVYSWPWARSMEVPTYRIVHHTKTWKEIGFVSGREGLRAANAHASQLASFGVSPNTKSLSERSDNLTLSGMWLSSMVFDYLADHLSEGRYWVVIPHSPAQADDMWRRVSSITLGDVVAIQVDELNEKEVGDHFRTNRARVFLVDIVEGACVVRHAS